MSQDRDLVHPLLPLTSKKKFRSIKAEHFLQKDKLPGAHSKGRRLCCTSCTDGKNVSRTIKLIQFGCVCVCSMLQTMAPWMLSTIEIVAVLCIYCLGTTRPVFLHPLPEPHHHFHFSYRHSLEDIVGISVGRALLLSILYAVDARHMHWPYLYASYLLAALCFPAIVVKTILFRYGNGMAVPAACLFGLTGLFCWLHVLAARRSAEWIRRRAQLGLTGHGFPYPWDASPDEGWLALHRAPDIEEMTKSSDGPDWGDEVAAETLADVDSKFVDVGGIRVHYKEALPSAYGPGSSSNGAVGIVLVHGFGGGVVSWRHLLEPLARQTGLRVVAYDRPAFGLTSKPEPTSEQDNPYTMDAQASLLLDFCFQIGLQELILAGHADGCLVALKANALLAAESHRSQPTSPPRPVQNAPPQFRPPTPPFGGGLSPSGPSAPNTVQGEIQAGARSSGRQSPSDHSHSRGSSQEGEVYNDAMSQFGSATSASSCALPFMSPASSCSFTTAHTGLASSSSSSTPYPPHSAGTSLSPSLPPSASSATTHTHPPPNYTTTSTHGSHLQIGLPPASECTPVSASACAADAVEMGLPAGGSAVMGVGGGSAASFTGGAASTVVSHSRSSSARLRKAQAMLASSSGQGAPNSASLHAWSPSERSPTCSRPLRIVGLALLHPDLSGSLGPPMARLLARTKLGRSILRPLLRSEIGEVANPRAWYNANKLTSEVMEVYKAPAEGWCNALIETARVRSSRQAADLSLCLAEARTLPCLVLTGLHDCIVPPARADELAAGLPLSRVAVLSECGHLAHEEVPIALLHQLQLFVSQVYA